MLGGSINVRSQLGKGTEVKVVLPMMRGFRGSETPVSTPNSTSTLDRQQDDSITVLREQARDTRVALYGFSTDSQDDNLSDSKYLNLHIEKSLAAYITEWYDIAVTSSWHPPSSVHIVIVDEEHLSALHTSDPNAPGAPAGPALVCLCSNATRYGQSNTCAGGGGVVEFVSKPFGPYKLAKALRICLDRVNSAKQNRDPKTVLALPEETSFNSGIGDAISRFEQVAIKPNDHEITPINILENGVVEANGASVNAQMAVEISPAEGKKPPKSGVDFPFPDAKGPSLEGDKTRRESRSGSLSQRKSFPLAPSTDTSHTDVVNKRGEMASTLDLSKETKASENELKEEKQPPKILLVDDNKINLRLLQTYMRKRQYKLVDSADNGREAVQASQQCEGYDIIFMGTPVLYPFVNHYSQTARYFDARDERVRSHTCDP